MKTILSIAGSDNTGGAGIQADIKTAMALDTYPATCITAVTAQNPQGIKQLSYVGDDLLRSQLKCTLDYIVPDAVKIGLLPCVSAIEIIWELLKYYHCSNIVLDPVLSATAGGHFLVSNESESKKIDAIKKYLFPLIDCITPNYSELKQLSEIQNDRITIQQRFDILEKEGLKNYIVLTGGDTDEKESCDIIYYSNSLIELRSPKIVSHNTHGTGCTFSTAITCNLAKGFSMIDSIKFAKKFTEKSILKGRDMLIMRDYGPIIQS